MAFMAGNNVHLIAFDLTFQDERMLTLCDALAKPLCHLLSLRLRQIELGRDLLVRQIQPHEIRAEHPNPQGLMVAREHRIGQIIKGASTMATAISLATDFVCVVPVLGDLLAIAVWAANAIGPSQFAHHFIAFRIVDQSSNGDCHP